MPAPKRVLEGDSSAPKAKKTKFADQGNSKANEQSVQSDSKLTAEEVDFPRGGGSSFTPLEVKTIRAEAVQEANDELFEVRRLIQLWNICSNCLQNTPKIKTKKRKSDAKGKSTTSPKDHIRVEHLNYKVGKFCCSIS